MRLCRLLLLLSLVLADDTEIEDNDDYYEDDDCSEDHKARIYEKKEDGMMSHHSFSSDMHHQNSSLPLSLYNFKSSDIYCIIVSNQLNCSWSTHTHPENAQYSASFLSNEEDHQLTCSKTANEKVECLGTYVSRGAHVYIYVNISIPSHLYAICHQYVASNLEKLNPPNNFTALIRSKNLEIGWSMPKNVKQSKGHCFMYELKMNNETIELTDTLKYEKKNIDFTKSYSLQIRTKQTPECSSSEHWSEWSEAVVIPPSENPSQLNVYIIVSIALVLPMILLAFLLVCRFQRLSEKLFPSIPSPSPNVTKLLENDHFSQVMIPQHATC